jgi:hypothetical protein
MMRLTFAFANMIGEEADEGKAAAAASKFKTGGRLLCLVQSSRW